MTSAVSIFCRGALATEVVLAPDGQPLPLGPPQQERNAAVSIFIRGALTTTVELQQQERGAAVSIFLRGALTTAFAFAPADSLVLLSVFST